ncbi:MAG: pilus assembly protein TadG-related protein [Pseudomonadota bacterium]
MSVINKTLRSFKRDQSGLIGIKLGLAMVPVMAITGAAMDYGQAVSQKFELQKKLDAATTAVCTRGTRGAEEVLRDHLNSALLSMGKTLSDEDNVEAVGSDQVVLLNPNFDPVTNVIKPTLLTSSDTITLDFLGIDKLEIDVSAGVACGSKRLELAVMMDTTGSMGSWAGGQRKLDSMKYAGNDLIDIFKSNMEAGATRIALVPFAEAVNVGNLANDVRGPYSSGQSNSPGAYKYRYKYKSNKRRTDTITSCVSERTGSERYTDAPPSQAYVGRVYTSNGSCKPNKEIMPLTNDEQALRSRINSLPASGGTAGHLGTAWAWYLISDKWAYLFDEESKPEVPNEEELTKAVILMTDGEYNEQYCNDVDDDRIWNCNAPNGSSKTQALALCTAMKNSGVQVYTVGFGISSNSSQANMLKSCATDEAKYFFPYDGTELRAAFASIGAQLAAGQAGKAVINY